MHNEYDYNNKLKKNRCRAMCAYPSCVITTIRFICNECELCTRRTHTPHIFLHTISHGVCSVVVARVSEPNHPSARIDAERKKQKKSKRNGQVSTEFPRFSALCNIKKKKLHSHCVSSPRFRVYKILIPKFWLHRFSCDLLCIIEL